MAPQQGGSVKLAGGLSTSGFTSTYDIRPGWVNSTNLQSRSVLGREQSARASWLISRGSSYKDSSSMSGAAHSNTSRASSTSGANAPGTCCADVGHASKPATKAGSEQLTTKPARQAGVQTPVYKAVPGSACRQDLPSGSQALQQNLLMSFSDPNGGIGPSTPSISDAGNRPTKRLSSAGTRSMAQTAAECLAPRSPLVKEDQQTSQECMQAAYVSTDTAVDVNADEEWLVRLVNLIQAPPSIDLVPLRSKFGRPHVAAVCH